MRLKINKSLCVGCKACEVVCSAYHYNEYNPKRSRIKLKFKHPLPSQPDFCLQCNKPKCAEACPTGALFRDDKNGYVAFIDEKCIRCKKCIAACPFNGIYFDEVNYEILKCDLCGGDPQCVKICQRKALELSKK